MIIAPRVKQLKKQKRSRTKLKVALFFILFLIVVVLLSYASKSSYFRIETISVSGNSITDTKDITNVVDQDLSGNYVYLFAKNNALIFPKKKITETLYTAFPRFSNVVIDAPDMHTLTISVTEREALYLWCGDAFDEAKIQNATEQCYYSDSEGYLYSKAPFFSGSIFLKLYGSGVLSAGDTPIGKYILTKEQLENLAFLKDSLKSIGIDSYAFNLKDAGEYEIFISPTTIVDGVRPKIIVNSKDDFKNIVENLGAALTTEPFATDFKQKFNSLEYIDLRFTNKVYYKFKTATDAPASSPVPTDSSVSGNSTPTSSSTTTVQ